MPHFELLGRFVSSLHTPSTTKTVDPGTTPKGANEGLLRLIRGAEVLNSCTSSTFFFGLNFLTSLTQYL